MEAQLYDTTPEADAELAGIPVRAAWVPTDALGSARHEVLLVVLREPHLVPGRRVRTPGADRRPLRCLSGRVAASVVRSAVVPPPRWQNRRYC